MDDLLSEKEQIEQLRTWWSDYGNYVIAGIVLGALGLFGYSYYQNQQADSAYAASALYSDLTDTVVDGDLDTAESTSGRIIAEYPDSPYAPQARLAMARLYMDQNRDEDAADTLNDLLGSKADEEYKQVARLRLAKIRLYQGKAEEALDLLGAPGDGDGAFAARFQEVRGDAYVALGRTDEAREAYREAMAETDQQATVNRQFVQLKLLDLPIEAVAAASEPATDIEPATATDAAAPDHDEVVPADAGADETADDEAGTEE